MILSNQSTVSVLPQSKKITKPKHDLPKRPTKDTQNDDYSVLETGYDIFLKEERDEILAILKRQILAFLGLDSSLMQNEAVEWTDLFGEIGTKSLNQMLIKVIPQYRPNLELTTRALINLRKKVKGWLTSEGASEKIHNWLGGDPLIHADEMPRFKQALVEVMKVRNFNQLRKDILPVIEDIRKQSLKRFDDTMFSKKFWSTFLNKEENKDIKDIWVSLPQKKNKCKKVANAADPYDSEVEKMQTEDNLLSKLSLALKQDNKKFWSEEEKEAKQEADLQAYISNFDESEPQYPVERVLADTEGFMTETSASSHNKHIWAEDKQNFIGEFWVQWNQRQYTDDAKFMMPVDDVLFKESEQQL